MRHPSPIRSKENGHICDNYHYVDLLHPNSDDKTRRGEEFNLSEIIPKDTVYDE